MSRRLLVVRHGQMELRASEARDLATIDRFFNQELEGGLSDRGRREAAAVARALGGEGVDALYSSTMIRARETAEATARALDLPIAFLDELRELRTGTLDPRSRAARFTEAVLGSALPGEAQRALVGLTLIPAYQRAWRRRETVGGETPGGLRMRLGLALDRIRRETPASATVAVFAHGYLLRALLRDHIGGLAPRLATLRRPYVPNGSITEVRDDGRRLSLVAYADARHL